MILYYTIKNFNPGNQDARAMRKYYSGVPKLHHPSQKVGDTIENVVTYKYKFLFMKRIVVVIILLACIGAVAFASLSRTNRTKKEKAPVKQEQKMEQKKEHKRHCMFS